MKQYLSHITLGAELNKNKTLLNALSCILIPVTIVLFSVNFYEFYHLGILNDIKEYPFGHEGPIAGVEHYKSADAYVMETGTWTIVSFISLSLAVLFRIRKKSLPLAILSLVLLVLVLVL